MNRADIRCDDDRLVYADQVGGERGELIVLQLAPDAPTPRDAGARRRRVRELLAQHGHAWSAVPVELLDPPHRGMRSTRFRGGFVDAIVASTSAFLVHHEALFAAEPQLSTVTFLDTTPAELTALCACPGYRRLENARFLQLEGQLDPALFTAAIRGDAFSHLRGINMERVVDPSWLTELDLARVERLGFRNLTRRTLLALAPRMPHLASLDLVGGTGARDELIAALPRTLRELGAGPLGDAQLGLLARSPAAAQLEHLRVSIATEPRLLHLFPRLRSLELAGLSRDATARRFAMVPLPALRELWLHKPARLPAIARALGPQLELLAVTGAPITDELCGLVAGDVWAPPLHDLNRTMLADHRAAFDPPSLRPD